MEKANLERVRKEETKGRPAPIDEDVEEELNAALPDPTPEEDEEDESSQEPA